MKHTLLAAALAFLHAFTASTATAGERWSAQRANEWDSAQPWLVGANFTPSTAINQLEMWQAETFDPATIDRELGWAANIGMNTMRVFLHHLAWQHDPDGFLDRVDRYLALADKHRVRTMFVLFDDCWNPHPKPGPQPKPRPHTHNSGWVQCPGHEILRQPERHAELKPYVQAVIRRFAKDPRVLAWDLYNEPGNTSEARRGFPVLPGKQAFSLELTRSVFAWAREVDPSQPLTVCIWNGDWPDPAKRTPLHRLVLEQSDIISFHIYQDGDKTRRAAASLESTGRPVLCTEYMARPTGSTFEAILPWFKDRKIGAWNWGLVAGKTQTQYPWDSWQKRYQAEPEPWFHDVLRPDGTPYRAEETKLIRNLTLDREKVARSNTNSARPNILWLVAEDIGPHLGCFGDPDAVTPRLDRLAADGIRFSRAWSNAPVCAPARTTLITGCLASSLGAEHMRSAVTLPQAMRLFPVLLREAGYYCTNNAKEDYNLKTTERVWDDSSGKAHYRNRPAGQPFFAVFNFENTHEGKIRSDTRPPAHNPATIHLPSCHPDTPASRLDWARYHDHISQMDKRVGKFLDELDAAGLADDTIVFFYGDNGPGMPRFKRFPGNAGLHVPLIVRVPEKWRHLVPTDSQPGGESTRLVSFVDFAPTVLSLAGLAAPAWMEGRAFLGSLAQPAPDVMFGFRGRMDERIDLARSATDGPFVYIRNFMPHLPWGQHVSYMFGTPTTRAWQELFDQGKLAPAQAAFWKTKPAEELYQLQTDPGETTNLADDPAHAAVLAKLREAVRARIIASRDPSLLPEAEMHRLAKDEPIADFAKDPARYPVEEILHAAEIASRPDPRDLLELRRLLARPHPGVRYWGATGLLIRGPAAIQPAAAELREALDDESPSVAIAAATALAHLPEDRAAALAKLRTLADAARHGTYAATAALNALDFLGPDTTPADFLEHLQVDDPTAPARAREYPRRLVDFLRQSRNSKQQNGS